VIPPKKQRGHPRPGRPISYNPDHYRGRNVVERCVGWLKECRALATRYEKLALNYLGLVKLGYTPRRWCRKWSLRPGVGLAPASS
jgi:transposase